MDTLSEIWRNQMPTDQRIEHTDKSGKTRSIDRRNFMKTTAGGALGVIGTLSTSCFAPAGSHRAPGKRPNILFAIADDWSWPHAGIAGDRVVKTPTFDCIAREGVLFTNAYVAAPSCTPSRGAILTGQWHWRLDEGVNLWSTLPAKFDVYPDILENAGYHVGFTRKGWGPGRDEAAGRTRNPAGDRYKNFETFLQARPNDEPFCFWFGSYDPHRGYKWLSGAQSGMKPQDVKVPAPLPDSEDVRNDICDYYLMVQRFDRELGEIIKTIEQNGWLDNTIVVITGDNGMPFPRCKSNLYDLGTNVPLAVRWPANVTGGRVVKDFISLTDLAPTFLELAGLKPIDEMTGRSFLDILLSNKSGLVDPARDHVLTGKERHTLGQETGPGGYPCRAIRSHDFLYIRNFKPDRWPAGHPESYRDIDGSPTKKYMMDHRDEPQVTGLFHLAFDKRPAEELYDLKKDPDQLHNVASQPQYAQTKAKLTAALTAELKATADPRILGAADVFETYPYYGSGGQKKK